MDVKAKKSTRSKNYEIIPPEGGWGYFIALSVMFVKLIGTLPTYTFGIIFGPHLATFGNEAKDISSILSIFNTIFLIAALLVNILVQYMSFRKVALLGSFLYVLGSFLTIFSISTLQIIFSFSVLAGIGWSLLTVPAMALFNKYFETRRDFVMNGVRAVISLIELCFPMLSKVCMDEYGLRGTTALLAAFSLHLVFAALCLHPVKWYGKKVLNLKALNVNKEENEEDDNLLKIVEHVQPEINSDNLREGSRSKLKKILIIVYTKLGLEHFRSLVYINLAFGLALVITSDCLFLALLPWILTRSGFPKENIPLLITIHISFEVAGKILLCIFTGITTVKNRHLQLIGAFVMGFFRVALMFGNSFWWASFVCGVLGLCHCLIQNTWPLVYAEMYPKKFVSAYTLSMAVLAITLLIFGQIIGLITSITQNENIVLFILGGASCLCGVTWIIEILWLRRKK